MGATVSNPNFDEPIKDPGTGPAADAGSGSGEGFTINMPVPAGAGEDEDVLKHGGKLGDLGDRCLAVFARLHRFDADTQRGEGGTQVMADRAQHQPIIP